MTFLNGNYIPYYKDTKSTYQRQPNYYGTPPFTKGNEVVCSASDGLTREFQRDGYDSQIAPYYNLGVVQCENCPFYSYRLPYNYPTVQSTETPDPKYYWYFPYYNLPDYYENTFTNKIPKPG